jgi:hypothetical protein
VVAEGVRLIRSAVPVGRSAGGLLLLAAALSGGCGTLADSPRSPPAPAYTWADIEHPTTAGDLARELGMKAHEDAALRALVLEGEGGRIVFVGSTRTILVAGRRYEAGEILNPAGLSLPLRADDAEAVRRTWREAMAEQREKEPERAAPSAAASPGRGASVAGGDPAWRVPLTRKWKGILIHHTATDFGNMARIDKNHREVNGWLGIGYDFLIDNGDGAPDGLVETTFRWKQQIQGAHAGPGLHEYNDHWVGICLVGDFNGGRPTPKQMASLKRLVIFLQSYCGIPEENIRMHRDVRETDCPGRRFPVQELVRDFPRGK